MAVDMFLMLDGIDGESADDAHAGEIDVLGWNWGVSQSGSMHIAKGGGAGKANVQDLIITKYLDKASPNLMQACCSGKHIGSAKLTCRKAGGDGPVEYLVMELTDVLVSNVSSGGSNGADMPIETLGLNFAEFKVTYTPQAAEGAGDAAVGPIGWNIQTNKAV